MPIITQTCQKTKLQQFSLKILIGFLFVILGSGKDLSYKIEQFLWWEEFCVTERDEGSRNKE
jgi:hypothetical protein